MFIGLIEFDDTKGKMTLTIWQPERFEQASNGLPFSIEKMRGGYSVLGRESGEFQKFSKCFRECKMNKEKNFYLVFFSVYGLKMSNSNQMVYCFLPVLRCFF